MTTNRKYLAKERVQVSKSLRIDRYYYRTGTALYITPKSADEPVVSVWIPYPTAEQIAELEAQVSKVGVSGNSYNKG